MKRYRTNREALEKESNVQFLKGSGPGGQHRNKRETGVRIVHQPSGITVTATERRSQNRNLDAAYERLSERLSGLNRRQKKRVPTAVPQSVERERLRKKRISAQKKKLRRQPSGEDY